MSRSNTMWLFSGIQQFLFFTHWRHTQAFASYHTVFFSCIEFDSEIRRPWNVCHIAAWNWLIRRISTIQMILDRKATNVSRPKIEEIVLVMDIPVYSIRHEHEQFVLFLISIRIYFSRWKKMSETRGCYAEMTFIQTNINTSCEWKKEEEKNLYIALIDIYFQFHI